MKLGKTTLPPEANSETCAVLGIRGSGKTNTAVVMVEQVYAERQVIVIDPTDVWWGLKMLPLGKSSKLGIPILGGPHGDELLPGEPGVGKAIAEALVNGRASAVLSVRHLRKNAQVRMMTEFFETLYYEKGSKRDPLTLVIDECDAFIPQTIRSYGRDGDGKGSNPARCVGAVEDLVRRGRAAGIAVVLISQRAASVNKDVLTQAETIIAHRHVGPHDRKALDEWVKLHDDQGQREQFNKGLAKLGTGEAFVWAPHHDVFAREQIQLRSTYDSSATPEAGATHKEPEKLDIPALRTAIAKVTDPEEQKRNDPKKLRETIKTREKRIAELEKQLASLVEMPDPQKLVERAVGAALDARDWEWQESVEQLRGGLIGALHDWKAPGLNGHVRKAVEGAGSSTPTRKGKGGIDGPASPRPTPTPSPTLRTGGPARRGASTPAELLGDLTNPHRKILDALAWWYVIGITEPTVGQVAFRAGYSPKGGAFNNNLSALSSRGLIERLSGAVRLTESGWTYTAEPEVGVELDDLHKCVLDALTNPQAAVLRVIIDWGDKEISVEEIASRTGYSAGGGAFNNNLSKLSSLGLINRGRGVVRPTEVLFPEGVSA